MTPTEPPLTNTPAPATPTPTASSPPTQAPSFTPTLAPSPVPTQLPAPSVEPPNTPVPVTTPQSSAENYRLKAWDDTTARRIYAEADTVPIAEEYADLREFYQLSLLEELYLSYPDLRTDPNLLRDQANLKGRKSSYWLPYGLLHDHAVEPFRQGLEQALNDGSAKLPELMLWDESIFQERDKSKKLFDGSTPATVLEVTVERGWDFFVLREEADGSTTVFALYPKWNQYAWNDETFQITDLNGNGREEIAIMYRGWGAGFDHSCQEKLFLYEWDGQTFQDIISTPLDVYMNTDYGNCLGINFSPDTAGRQLIHGGISKNTSCEDYPYLEPVTYRWDGKGFVPLATTAPVPPGPRDPDTCTIGWALAAGAENDSALKLLAAAVADWPAEADAVWGPAAHDYFKIRLAIWYMRRGQWQRGVDLFKQVRDTPTAPEFHFIPRLGAVFLETYETNGIHHALTAVRSLYEEERDAMCPLDGCNTKKNARSVGDYRSGMVMVKRFQ